MDSKTYLEAILKGLIDYPDQLTIEQGQDDMGILLSVHVARSDMGKIIGKEGATAKAIRRLIDAFGYRLRQKVSVKILEPIN